MLIKYRTVGGSLPRAFYKFNKRGIKPRLVSTVNLNTALA
ncbi:hypothetical protein PNIG_a0563 [Pseudoalteromonas nigrifaciens]|uniref:Uncharacterized protein n=1 Tax=Pseudoalteromonas nigrifaciens TaxID=28109 RepID=A0AAC9UFS9_9GAMM|nr:hypothetical protein PNIG_a0563 [Pseudoalteromonas nigrifaciens]SJN42095.1 hypothetical protein CZ797_10745 [Pseudoalteromonas sp. JB197]